MKCKDCEYWVEAEGFERKDNVGGCIRFYSNDNKVYMPTFLEDECILNEPWKSEVEEEHSIK